MTAASPSAPSPMSPMAAFMQQLFEQPWMKELMGDLYRRQGKSLQRVAELREVSVNSAILWPFSAIQMPLCLERAEGGRVWDVDGNEYIDIHMGFGTQSLHGHNPEPVVRMVREGLGKTVGNGYFASIEVEHARLLRELMPHNEKFAFLNSGGEATHGAIRLARTFTGKRLVVRFEGSVQGSHDLGVYNSMPMFHGHPMIPFPPQEGDGIKLQSYVKGVTHITDKDLLILNQADPKALDIIARRKDEIACVIVEPIQAGFPFPEKTIPFIKELSEVCRKSGVVFILDEVQSGFRHGISGAAGHYGIRADLITYGKVLGGLGLPMSAIAGRADILDLTMTSGMSMTDWGQKTFFSATHVGNNLAILASYATILLLKEKGPAFYERTRKKVQIARDRVEAIKKQGIPLKLLGYGDFIGLLSFVDESRPIESVRDLSYATNPLAGAVLAFMLRRSGVNTYGLPFVYLGDGQSEQDITTVFDKVEASVAEMKRNNFPFVLPR